jgi:hypothetical protein
MYLCDGTGVTGLASSLLLGANTYGAGRISLQGTVPAPGSPVSNLLTIFGFVDQENSWAAGLDFTGRLSQYLPGIVLGRIVNGLWQLEAFKAPTYTLRRGTLYTINTQVTAVGSATTVQVTVNGQSITPFVTGKAPVPNGAVGVGTYGGGQISISRFCIGETL